MKKLHDQRIRAGPWVQLQFLEMHVLKISHIILKLNNHACTCMNSIFKAVIFHMHARANNLVSEEQEIRDSLFHQWHVSYKLYGIKEDDICDKLLGPLYSTACMQDAAEILTPRNPILKGRQRTIKLKMIYKSTLHVSMTSTFKNLTHDRKKRNRMAIIRTGKLEPYISYACDTGTIRVETSYYFLSN